MSELLLEQDGPVATDRDADVRVVILTGAGDRAFASGTDIRQFLASRPRVWHSSSRPSDRCGRES